MTEKNEKKKLDYYTTLIRFKELVPITSIGLVFLGYWNLDSYYRHFGINIYNYITASEILLSFLPSIIMTVDWILTLFFMLIFGVFLRLSIEPKPKETTKPHIDTRTEDQLKLDQIKTDIFYGLFSFKPLRILNNIINLFNWKIFNIGGRKDTANNIFFLFVRIGVLLFPIGVYSITIFFFISLSDFGDDIQAMIANKHNILDRLSIIIIFSGIIIYFFIVEDTDLIRDKTFNIAYIAILASIFVVIFLRVSNKIDAIGVLSGNSHVHVSIQVKNQKVSTDINSVYIGHTQNYLFLTMLKDSTNVIYKMSDIEKLETKLPSAGRPMGLISPEGD